jgi:uncharacterized protein YndB with AHSA1/START domain
MPLKRDDSGRHWVEMEFLVPGTVEQVWHAIATGPGMTAWFTPTTVDERVGGAINFDFGEGDCGQQTSSGIVTEWDPPHRLAYEEHGWSGEAPPVATEVVVTSHSGDRCVIRMVHSLFTSKDDWDDELESFEGGWPVFFAVLRLYLRHFAGRPAAAASVMIPSEVDGTRAWSELTEALNLAGANVGDRRAAPAGAPALSGEVELLHQDRDNRYVMLRLDEPADGVAVIGAHCAPGATMVTASLFFYGPGATDLATEQEAAWSRWLPDRVRSSS